MKAKKKASSIVVPMPIGHTMTCAQCQRDGGVSTGVKPNFLCLPGAWLFAVGRTSDRTIIVTCCSATCAHEWQQANIVDDREGALQ